MWSEAHPPARNYDEYNSKRLLEFLGLLIIGVSLTWFQTG